MSPPYSVVHLQDTDSTQDDARHRFDGDPVLVVADSQRQGRGRSGSVWRTAPRAVAASLAWRPGWEPSDLPLVALVAGVAAARLFECGIKWPNDLLVGDAKVGGLLVESTDGVVVAGLGLNLWWPDSPYGFGALHPADPGPGVGRELGTAWAATLLALTEAGPGAWPRDEYLTRSVTVGTEIGWVPDGSGRAVGISPDGGLIVETPEGRSILRAGEVRHVR